MRRSEAGGQVLRDLVNGGLDIGGQPVCDVGLELRWYEHLEVPLVEYEHGGSLLVGRWGSRATCSEALGKSYF